MNGSRGIVLAGALALAGCGGPPADPVEPAPAPAANRELLDAARAPLERAQSVQGIQDEQKRAMDAQIDQADR